jgi:hypothetical protein
VYCNHDTGLGHPAFGAAFPVKSVVVFENCVRPLGVMFTWAEFGLCEDCYIGGVGRNYLFIDAHTCPKAM